MQASAKAVTEIVKMMTTLLEMGKSPMELIMEYAGDSPATVVGYTHAMLREGYKPTALVARGGIEAICSIMAHHPDNNRIQYLALQSLIWVANTDENVNAVLGLNKYKEGQDGDVEHRRAMKTVEVQIHEAHSLASADARAGGRGVGRSDPYCLIYWNDKKVGQTLIHEDTNDPVWEDETFRVRYPPGLLGSTLRLEVRDKDDEGIGDLLGQVIIGGPDILKIPSLEKVMFELQRNQDSQEEQIVKGELGIIINMRHTGDRDELEINM